MRHSEIRTRDTPNTDAERRYISLWKSFGGSQHGPNIEHVTMPYEKFFEFMAGFENDTRGKCANTALAIDSGRGNEKEIARAILDYPNK